MRAPRVYRPADWPDVEVLVDDVWCPGELRAWWPVGEDGWEATVQWRAAAGAGTFLEHVPAERVRPAAEGAR